MFKKILITSVLLAATSNLAFAYAAPYVGASVGVDVNTVVNVNKNNFNRSSFRGIPVSLFAGYGAVLSSNFYLGGEVTGTVGTMELNNNGLKSTYGYGASLLPGFMLCDHTLAYLRLGVVSTRFPNISSSSTGGQVGVGLQTSLTQNVDLRGEYDYIAYREVSYHYRTATHQYVDTNVTPRSDQFNLALVYKFD